MTSRTRLVQMFPLLLFSLCTTFFVQPLSAFAAVYSGHKAITHYFWGKSHLRHNQQRNGASNSNLLYHNGPVMEGTTQVYAIFWEPTGSFVDPTYDKLLQRYFQDVGSSALYQNNAQYPDTTGKAPQSATSATVWVDTKTPFPSNQISDTDIQNEVVNALNTKGWTPALNHVFFVFTTVNELICDSSGCSAPGNGGFCGYHSSFPVTGTNNPVIYAAMPYAGNDLIDCYTLGFSPNNDPAADAEVNITSHEQMEAATDPLANAWYGVNGGQDEIGDKCAWIFGQFQPNGSDVTWNGHPYVVQAEWDNAISGCAIG